MNPFYSSRISDCRGLDDIPQSIDTSKRCLDDRTLRNDTSYLMQNNMQNNLTQNINLNHRTFQDNSHNGTFFIQNQNGILEDRMVSFVNCSFNRPSKKINDEGDEEGPDLPETPPQNEREMRFYNGDILVQQEKEEEINIEDYGNQNESNQIDNGEMNMRQELNQPFNFQQNLQSSAINQQNRPQIQQQQQQQQQPQQNVRNPAQINSNQAEDRQRQIQQLYIRQLLLQRQAQQERSRIQQPPPSSLRQMNQAQQFQSPQNSSEQQQNQLSIQRQQNPFSRISSGQPNERRRNQNRQSGNSQNNYLDSFNSYLQSLNFNIVSNNQQNYQPSRIYQNNHMMRQQMQSRNSNRQYQRDDDLSDIQSANQNDIENVDYLEQQRQVEQLSQIIRNSRRRMDENRRAQRENQIQVGGRIQQVVELEEEDKLRAKLIFKKALTHLIILTVFSIFLLSVFYIHLLMEGLWLILFFIFCFFSGNKLSIYKSLPEDVSYEEKRQAFFDIIEFIFINILIFMIFLFFKLINQPITLLFIYTPFVHIIWWLVFTTKTSESMNRHIELLLRIYAVTQAILFAVQYDSIVNWSWISIFLPSWILLSSLGFYIFGLSVLFFCSLYYCILGQTDKYQIKGLIWCLLVSIHIVGSSLFFLLGLMNYFETGNLQLLRYSSATLISGSAFSTLYSIACSQDLEIFIALANSENLFNGAHQVQQAERRNQNQNDQQNDEENNDAQQNQNDNNQPGNFINSIANFSQAANRAQDGKILQENYYLRKYSYQNLLGIQPKKIKIIKTTRAIPRSIPQFLIRFSSTYFQQSDVNRELITLLQKKNMEIIKKKKSEQKDKENKKKLSPKGNSNKKISLSNIQNGRMSVQSNKNNNDESKQSKQLDEKGNTQGQVQSMKETNRSRQDSKLTSQPSTQQCLVCFDNQPDSVILECGHGGLCNSCALDIWKKTGECYLCRQTITKIVQIDLNEKLGKYKQIVAISHMHEVSHEQEQNNRSEQVVQHQQSIQSQNNNIDQNVEHPFEEQLNYQIQHAGEQLYQAQQQLQSASQIENQNNIQQQLQNQEQQQQIQQVEQQVQEQPQQEQFQDQESMQNNNQLDQQPEIKEEELNENHPIGLDQKQQQEEDITILQFDEDEERREPDERHQYQDSTLMKVTLSQYTSLYNNQAQFSSMSISDFENNQNSIRNEQKKDNQYEGVIPKQTLNIEKQINQIEEINSKAIIEIRQHNQYESEPINTFKKPELKSKQQLESTVFQSPSHQNMMFDETRNGLTQQNWPLGVINDNVAQPLPVSPEIKKLPLNVKEDKQNNTRNTYLSDQKEIARNSAVLINQKSQTENKNKQQDGTNQNSLIQEWDINETQQSSNRSQHNQNKQSTRNTIHIPNNGIDIAYPSYNSQDTYKIQTLDKYMSKYFDSTNYEDQNSELTKDASIFALNKNAINQQNFIQENVLQQQPQINKNIEDIINFTEEDKENGFPELDDIPPPPIQRLGILKYQLNGSTSQLQEQQTQIKGEDILIEPLQLKNQQQQQQQQQEIEQQLSSVRVDKEKELINFEESEDQSQI